MKLTTTELWVGGMLSYIALGLIISGQAHSYWVVFPASASRDILSYGLYQLCTGNSCFSLSWTPTLNELAAFSTRIILIVADIFLIAAFICGCLQCFLDGVHRMRCLTIAGSLNIISGVITLIAMVVYTIVAEMTFLNTSSATGQFVQTYYFGYCYGFGWASGILFIVAGALQIKATLTRKQTEETSNLIMSSTNSSCREDPPEEQIK